MLPIVLTSPILIILWNLSGNDAMSAKGGGGGWTTVRLVKTACKETIAADFIPSVCHTCVLLPDSHFCVCMCVSSAKKQQQKTKKQM